MESRAALRQGPVNEASVPGASKSPTVLFVASGYGHLAAFHLPFMQLLALRGYRVHAAASGESGMERVEATGCVCHDVPFSRTPFSLGNLRAYFELRRLLRRQKYALVHVHTPVAAWIARLAASRSGRCPVLYTAHGFHFYQGAPLLNWLLYYSAERLAARWTRGLVVMNDEDWAQARKMGFSPGKNLFRVHGVGVDLKTYGAAPDGALAREQLHLGPEDFVITCVGEMIPRKNHRMLLEAWRDVGSREDRAHLLLVGDGPLRRRLEKEVRTRRLPRVQFLGFRRDIPAILSASDVLVLPSKQEGLARCIMEAMAAGRPVVATDIRGNRDLVLDGETGLLVRVKDVKGLAGAVLRLAHDAHLCGKMGRAGRQRVAEFSLEAVLQEMSAVYDRFLPQELRRS